MKNQLLWIIPLAIFAAAPLFTDHSHAQSRQAHEVVILQGQPTYQLTDNGPHYTGIAIWCSSSSSGAPIFDSNNAASITEAIAQLLNAGYHIEHIEGMNYTLIK